MGDRGTGRGRERGEIEGEVNCPEIFNPAERPRDLSPLLARRVSNDGRDKFPVRSMANRVKRFSRLVILCFHPVDGRLHLDDDDGDDGEDGEDGDGDDDTPSSFVVTSKDRSYIASRVFLSVSLSAPFPFILYTKNRRLSHSSMPGGNYRGVNCVPGRATSLRLSDSDDEIAPRE